jgi:hypothetical protein
MILETQDRRFDESLNKIPNLKWIPWIGRNYTKTRFLILGESYYDNKDESDWIHEQDAPRIYINNQGLRSSEFPRSNFLRNTENTVLFQDQTTEDEQDNFWTSVAYFNLVQRLLPSNDDRPTDSDYDLGWQTVLEVAKLINPEIILRLGQGDKGGRLANYLNHNDTGWERNVDDFYTEPRIINLKRPELHLKIIFINHPSGSRGFDYVKWAEIIKDAAPALKDKIIGLS